MKNLDQKINWIISDKYDGDINEKIINDIQQLKDGKPIDYIIGWKSFLNCKIDLSFKPLIPRPETEFWTEKAIGFINNSESEKIIAADVFSGSGCIGIAILKNLKNSKVDFFEIDKKLIKQIELNLKLNKINKYRYQIIQSDILKNAKQKYDFIFANPPYISTEKKNKVQKSVLKFEPKKALFGGQDGLIFIKKFLKQSQNHLSCTGQIWMEFDSFQKPQINKILKELGYKKWEFYKDQYKKLRYAKITFNK